MTKGVKFARCLCAALLFIATTMWGDPQLGAVYTVATAGTAVPLVNSKSSVQPVKFNSLFIQTPHCTTCGIIYVLNCNPQITCVNGSAGTTLVAEISAGTSTSPGGWFRFPTNGSASNSAGGNDLRYWALDSTVSGVSALVSYDLRQ